MRVNVKMVLESGRTAMGAAVTIGALLATLAGPATPASAAGVSVDLDQWANADAMWQNGNLNGNNAAYPEGGVIPFRLAIEGLSTGSHTITISYDFTASGHKAYDFLATWNATNHPGLCQPSGGAISSMCPGLPAASTFAFPSDPFVANGLGVSGAQSWAGVGRRLTIYGGTITSISGPVHSGSVNGNSTAEFTVHFSASGKAVLLAWGGHLAQSRYWDVSGGGARDGASMVSGAPWHMRTLNLDGGGARNQDRSIQPSAIIGELPQAAPSATPRPATPAPAGPAAPPPTSRPGGGGGAPASSYRPTIPPTTTAAPGDRPASRGLDGVVVLMILLASLAALALLCARPPRRRPRDG